MTSKAFRSRKTGIKTKQNNPLPIVLLPFVYHKGRTVSVSQDSILEMKNPVPIAKLI